MCRGYAGPQLAQRRASRVVLELSRHQVVRAGDGGSKETEETSLRNQSQQHQDPPLKQSDGQHNAYEAEELDPGQNRLIASLSSRMLVECRRTPVVRNHGIQPYHFEHGLSMFL